MESFWAFFESCLGSVPEDLGTTERFQVDQLPYPERFLFDRLVPMQAGDDKERVLAALADMYNNMGDVADLADLQGFSELDIHVVVPATGQ